jgi:hypothetical protein
VKGISHYHSTWACYNDTIHNVKSYRVYQNTRPTLLSLIPQQHSGESLICICVKSVPKKTLCTFKKCPNSKICYEEGYVRFQGGVCQVLRSSM